MSRLPPSHLVRVNYSRSGMHHTFHCLDSQANFLSPTATKVVVSEQDEIELDIPKEGLKLSSGWSITPVNTTKIQLHKVCRAQGVVTSCTLRVQWTRPEEIPVKLYHEIELLGAKPPNNFITLEIGSQ